MEQKSGRWNITPPPIDFPRRAVVESKRYTLYPEFDRVPHVVPEDASEEYMDYHFDHIRTERETVHAVVNQIKRRLDWIRKNTDFDWQIEIIGTKQKMDGDVSVYGINFVDTIDFYADQFTISEDDE